MSETTLSSFSFKITYVHESGTHVIGLRKIDKKVVFLNVAHAEQSCVGQYVHILSARMIEESECPPKFYKPYGINDPYEHGWKFQRLVNGSVIFEMKPPFREIPISTAENRENNVGAMKVGTSWSNGKQTWVVRDTCIEKLAGQEKLRVWITDESGRRGQAMYAESLFKSYKLMRQS